MSSEHKWSNEYIEILHNECLFPIEIAEIINAYSPKPVSKCAAVVCKYARGHAFVGRKCVCVVDDEYCIVYSGKTFKPIRYFHLEDNSQPIAMDTNDNLIVLFKNRLILYKTQLGNITENIQAELNKLDVLYSELKVVEMYKRDSPALDPNEKKWAETKRIISNILSFEEFDWKFDEYCEYISSDYIWNDKTIPCTIYINAKYHKNNSVTLITGQIGDIIRVNLSNEKKIVYKNFEKKEIRDVFFPTRYPNYMIVLYIGYLIIDGRPYYNNTYTRVYVPKDCDTIIESPDGKKILVYNSYCGVYYTRDLGTTNGVIIDLATGIAEDAPVLANTANFIENNKLFVHSNENKYSIVSASNIESIDIGESVMPSRHWIPQQLSTGDIFIGYKEKIPVLDNKNCKIIGSICGMLENGTVVSETDNELRFYT